MYGNRGRRFGGQHGLMPNANMLIGNQMLGLQQGAGLFPMNPPMPGGFNMNRRRNMPQLPQDAVIDMLVICRQSVMSIDELMINMQYSIYTDY